MSKNKLQRKPKNVWSGNITNIEENSNIKKWFEEVNDDPKEFKPVSEQVLIELKDEAKKCHDSEVVSYNIKNAKTNPNYQWMKTVMSKGTVSDKIAAFTVFIQDNPVCSLDTLHNLVNMVKVGKKKECIMVIDTLTELFLTDLLIPDKKLKAFHQRPLSILTDLSSGNIVTKKKLLSIWYFEDQLKELYTSFVLALNKVALDVLDSNKEKAISSMLKLLTGNPEQEKNLLTYIVNKIGDPSQKIASKAIYSLGQLLFKHPNMQAVVLNEVEKLLFRSNISTKAQYYSLCFLSQFYLSHDSNEVARRLIEVYFAFFKSCIKKGEVDSRMMSALLMGVNRAYPYAKLELEKISDHIDTIYRVVHVANFNISLHALSLLYQVSVHENTVSDRFYSALYKKLIDPKLLTTTHQAMLLSLIFKAILKDTEIVRIKVFVKRLLQVSLRIFFMHILIHITSWLYLCNRLLRVESCT
jgi:ribosome biogenesis protein MAK21